MTTQQKYKLVFNNQTKDNAATFSFIKETKDYFLFKKESGFDGDLFCSFIRVHKVTFNTRWYEKEPKHLCRYSQVVNTSFEGVKVAQIIPIN